MPSILIFDRLGGVRPRADWLFDICVGELKAVDFWIEIEPIYLHIKHVLPIPTASHLHVYMAIDIHMRSVMVETDN